MRRSYSEIVDDYQPLTVTSDDVIDFLERRGQSRMANVVRSLIDKPEDLRREVTYQRDRANRLAERLKKHEPPEASKPVARSYRSGPECDG